MRFRGSSPVLDPAATDRPVPSRGVGHALPHRSTRSRVGVWLGLAATVVVTMAILAPGQGPLGIGEAAMLGAVEGVTEFLPVSSTAHLAITERLLGVADTPAQRAVLDSYAIVIQGGAILAVAVLYRRRLESMVRHRGPSGRGVLGTVLVASVPAGIVGLAAGDLVKERLFAPGPIAVAWLAGGMAILLVARRVTGRDGRPLEAVGWGAAAAIGAAQCLALWPGTSRSLVTIVAGILVGLSVAAAVELSFLVGFVTLMGASGLEALRHGPDVIAVLGWVGPVTGALVAFACAAAAIRGFVVYLSHRDLRPFGWYRVAAAAATGTLMAAGIL